MKRIRRIPTLVALFLFVAFPMSAFLSGEGHQPLIKGGDSKVVTISLDACEDKRDLCLKSCSKQRGTCDRNNPSAPKYCSDQDEVCTKGCNDTWRKCQQKP